MPAGSSTYLPSTTRFANGVSAWGCGSGSGSADACSGRPREPRRRPATDRTGTPRACARPGSRIPSRRTTAIRLIGASCLESVLPGPSARSSRDAVPAPEASGDPGIATSVWCSGHHFRSGSIRHHPLGFGFRDDPAPPDLCSRPALGQLPRAAPLAYGAAADAPLAGGVSVVVMRSTPLAVAMAARTRSRISGVEICSARRIIWTWSSRKTSTSSSAASMSLAATSSEP